MLTSAYKLCNHRGQNYGVLILLGYVSPIRPVYWYMYAISRKGGTGGGGWGYPQGAVHITAVRLGCISNMVGTRLANSHPGSIAGLENATLIL